MIEVKKYNYSCCHIKIYVVTKQSLVHSSYNDTFMQDAFFISSLSKHVIEQTVQPSVYPGVTSSF